MKLTKLSAGWSREWTCRLMPERYNCKAERTTGELEVLGERGGGGGMVYALRGSTRGRLVIGVGDREEAERRRLEPRSEVQGR